MDFFQPIPIITCCSRPIQFRKTDNVPFLYLKTKSLTCSVCTPEDNKRTNKQKTNELIFNGSKKVVKTDFFPPH